MIPYQTFGKYWVIKPFLSASPYFVLAGLAVFFGTLLAYYEAKRRKLNPNHIIFSIIPIFLFSAFFARVFHFLGPWSWHKDYALMERFIYFFGFKSGMVFYGGLIGAVFGVWIYTKFKHTNFWKYADAWMPSCGIMLFLGRIGCFTAGCCFGKESELALPWLIQRSNSIIHPSQLYLALAALLLFVILTELKFYQKFQKKFDGYVFLWGVVIYSIMRFFIEFTRHYDVQIFYLTPSQIISLILIAISAIFIILRSK